MKVICSGLLYHQTPRLKSAFTMLILSCTSRIIPLMRSSHFLSSSPNCRRFLLLARPERKRSHFQKLNTWITSLLKFMSSRKEFHPQKSVRSSGSIQRLRSSSVKMKVILKLIQEPCRCSTKARNKPDAMSRCTRMVQRVWSSIVMVTLTLQASSSTS